MCHVIELRGGIGDGITFDVCVTPPRNYLVWHETHDDFRGCNGTVVRDMDDPDTALPVDTEIAVYRRRFAEVHRLHLPSGTVAPLPYDVVREPAEQQTYVE